MSWWQTFERTCLFSCLAARHFFSRQDVCESLQLMLCRLAAGDGIGNVGILAVLVEQFSEKIVCCFRSPLKCFHRLHKGSLDFGKRFSLGTVPQTAEQELTVDILLPVSHARCLLVKRV